MNAETTLGHPPFCLPDRTPAPHLEDQFLEQAAALICGGPSFAQTDHNRIRESGLLTMTLNNSVQTYRSDLWLGVDSPAKFDATIWGDPHITKFVTSGCATHDRVLQGVNVIVYQRSDNWCSEQIFAPGNTIGWATGRGSGARTSMIDAIRVLFLLGVRTIYLFGVDFHQSLWYGYHHAAPGYRRSIAGNNRIYAHLGKRFALLRPLMESAGLRVYNCNPESHLEAFEKREFPILARP